MHSNFVLKYLKNVTHSSFKGQIQSVKREHQKIHVEMAVMIAYCHYETGTECVNLSIY